MSLKTIFCFQMYGFKTDNKVFLIGFEDVLGVFVSSRLATISRIAQKFPLLDDVLACACGLEVESFPTK